MKLNSGYMGLLALCILAPLPVPLFAQSYTASIRGVVTDPTRASVAGAEVVAAETERNIRQATTTDSVGRYVLTNLPPGKYTLTVEARGFKKYARENFELQVNQDASIDVALQVGDMAESVTVTGEAALLESTTSSINVPLGYWYLTHGEAKVGLQVNCPRNYKEENYYNNVGIYP